MARPWWRKKVFTLLLVDEGGVAVGTAVTASTAGTEEASESVAVTGEGSAAEGAVTEADEDSVVVSTADSVAVSVVGSVVANGVGTAGVAASTGGVVRGMNGLRGSIGDAGEDGVVVVVVSQICYPTKRLILS